MKEKVKFILGLLMAVVCLIYGAVLMFTNPDMTEIRLLLTYWKEYIAMFIVIILGVSLINSTLK